VPNAEKVRIWGGGGVRKKKVRIATHMDLDGGG